MTRSRWQKIKDLITFPLRALILFEDDRWGVSSLRSERFDYCASQVHGYCLDVGCGRNNIFIRDYLDGNGKGVDIFPYEGLGKNDLLENPAHFPFEDNSFETVTFIASLNHVPESLRDAELAEAYRCLRPGGDAIVTMGVPLVEVLIHQVVPLYDKLFGTNHDMDGERGMDDEETYYLTDKEIVARLSRAGFRNITKKRFCTQWGLNAMFIGRKLSGEE